MTVTLTKALAIALLVAIVLSLLMAFRGLMRKGREHDRSATVRALTVRVALSIVLFILLLLAAAFGFIQPHALRGG